VPDVLVLRALGLGDTLAAVPALRALRRAVAGSIMLAGPAGPAELLRRDGVVDDVLPTEGLHRLARADAGVAVNLHGRGPQSHHLLQRASPDELVAFACAEAGVPGPLWRQDEPERSRWCRLITSRWDVTADPDDVRLPADGLIAPVTPDVVVHPGAASASRRWPLERWSTVIRALQGDRRVVITGGPDERDAALALAARSGLRTDDVLAGATSLQDLAGLVAQGRLVLSGDTGMAHLAYAFGTPSVTLFGPTPPRWWGPPTTGPHIALWKGAAVGDPHGTEADPALLRLQPADVLAAVRTLAGDATEPLPG
jgi:ADP-heptose:LPS heptosyltransferase